MSSVAATLLPRIPSPPHDPRWWRLDGRIGWRAAAPADQAIKQVEITADSGTLVLAQTGPVRSTVEPSGSLGGVVPPSNVAIGPGCSVYLLDSISGLLKRFNACQCEFHPVPCLGGAGSSPRQFNTPHGIAVHHGRLFVCDTGNNRVSIFSLHGFVLRPFWTLPTAAAQPQTWQPYDLAFDRRGRAYVTDPANGCIHCFAASGIWEKSLPGFGFVTWIAIDCHDRVYALVQGEAQARCVDLDGNDLGPVSGPAAIRAAFPPMPFSVDAAGNLDLRQLCQCVSGTGIFDVSGTQLPHFPQLPQPAYYGTGTFISGPLDSKLYRCQWHRVLLHGCLPESCGVQIATFTSEVLRTLDEIPDDEWQTNQTAFGLGNGSWDCLVLSGPGRYLWLQIGFTSTGDSTPCLDHVKIEFPRISLARYLPAAFAEDPNGANFTDRLLSIFDTTLRSVERELDYQAKYFDPLSTPATKPAGANIDFLTWLASWVGISLDRQWPVKKRRALLKKAPSLFSIRGTRYGLWQQLLLLLGLDPQDCCCPHDQPRRHCRCIPRNCRRVEKKPCAWQAPPLILEHFYLRRWLFLGSGRLSDHAVLWGKRIVNRSQLNANAQASVSQLIMTQDPYRDPFHVYAHKFSVFVPAACGKSDVQKRALMNLLNSEKPAHTQYQLEFVGPRFRIGFQSMIGLDSVVGRYTEGVALNSSQLGSGTVLGPAENARSGPSLSVGKQARVGYSTRLE